jgi:pyridoxine 4-dehydrogenase
MESLTPAVEAVRDGLVRWVGLSNVSLEQIKEAQGVVKIVAIQNQYNLWHRSSEFGGVIEYCERSGLIFMPWAPLGGKNVNYSLSQRSLLESLARKYQTSIYSILLAWLFAKSNCIVPIPGTSNPQHIDLWADALNFQLLPQDAFRLECTVFHPVGHAM